MMTVRRFTAIAAIAGTVATACTAETHVNDNTPRSEPVSPTETLTGQDIGEANGALDALLEDAIAADGVTAREYLILRVLARGPQAAPRAFYAYLVGQRQLKLDMTDAVDNVRALETRGLISGADPDGPGPVALTDSGAELNKTLAASAAPIAQHVFGDVNPADLQTTHRVLRDIINRAQALRGRR
jgi:DNA-binding MarR family transcriptional regulator